MMNEYKKGYFILFSACADAVEEIEKHNLEGAKQLLIDAMQRSEQAYIEYAETKDVT